MPNASQPISAEISPVTGACHKGGVRDGSPRNLFPTLMPTSQSNGGILEGFTDTFTHRSGLGRNLVHIELINSLIEIRNHAQMTLKFAILTKVGHHACMHPCVTVFLWDLCMHGSLCDSSYVTRYRIGIQLSTPQTAADDCFLKIWIHAPRIMRNDNARNDYPDPRPSVPVSADFKKIQNHGRLTETLLRSPLETGT